jgi:hypothetical protein
MASVPLVLHMASGTEVCMVLYPQDGTHVVTSPAPVRNEAEAARTIAPILL